MSPTANTQPATAHKAMPQLASRQPPRLASWPPHDHTAPLLANRLPTFDALNDYYMVALSGTTDDDSQ